MPSILPPVPDGYLPWKSVAEALLIGLLIGSQRETAASAQLAGLREFMLVAVVGCVCGLLDSVPLALGAMAIFTAFWISDRERATPALTTAFALLVTFVLAVFTSLPRKEESQTIALALAVIVVGLLEFKRQLRKFFTETITQGEFIDTIRFLAMVFVIYPILPEGKYGPYQFFEPRKVWLFVILVSSISFLGYFFEKFARGNWGLRLTAILGGLASTTAATTAFARKALEEPHRTVSYWQATTIANAIQFPRVLLLVYAISADLGHLLLLPLLTMSVVGLAIGSLIRADSSGSESPSQLVGNPFRVRPALRFGLLFAGITLLTRAVAANFGTALLKITAAIAGLLDVDAVTASNAELAASNQLDLGTASNTILIALAANALFKTGIAFAGGTRPFGWRTLGSFLAMVGAGAIVLALR